MAAAGRRRKPAERKSTSQGTEQLDHTSPRSLSDGSSGDRAYRPTLVSRLNVESAVTDGKNLDGETRGRFNERSH